MMSYLPATYTPPWQTKSVDFLKRNANQVNGVGTADANAGIDDTDGTDYRGRAVRWSTGTDMTMQLCNDDEEIHGTIDNISSGKMSVALQGLLNFRNGTAAALTRGHYILGATRVTTSGGAAQYGYVKATAETSGAGAASVDDIRDALRAKGTILAGGATPVANTEAAADVVVAFV